MPDSVHLSKRFADIGKGLIIGAIIPPVSPPVGLMTMVSPELGFSLMEKVGHLWYKAESKSIGAKFAVNLGMVASGAGIVVAGMKLLGP